MATTYFRYPVVGGGSGGSAIWGDITGTLSAQTDLQNALNLKAPLASPAFTGTATFGSYQSINADGSIGLTAADTSLGNHSAVFGYGATSSGFQGVAIGYGATSVGNYGIAIGTGSSADSYSIGIMGNALGASQGVAIGYSSKAYGTDTLALGFAATANSNYASAIGPGTSTAYSYSTVIGSDWSNSGNLNDTLAQGGLTLGGYNPAMGVATGEVWAALKAGATANTPRFILNPAVTTDDTTSAFQMTGVASFNAGAFTINVDGSVGPGAANNGGITSIVMGPSSTLAGGSTSAAVYGPNNTISGINAVGLGAYNSISSQNAVAVGISNGANYTAAIAVGYGNTANNFGTSAIGSSNTASSALSQAFGYSVTSSSAGGVGVGKYITVSFTNSAVFGSGGSITPITDAQAPGGITLGGLGPSANVAENWLMVLPGTTSDTPRMLLGAGVTDDNSSAIQPYGAIKLCDYTTVGTPVKGQIAYNYTTGAITSYNGSAWI